MMSIIVHWALYGVWLPLFRETTKSCKGQAPGIRCRCGDCRAAEDTCKCESKSQLVKGQ